SKGLQTGWGRRFRLPGQFFTPSDAWGYLDRQWIVGNLPHKPPHGVEKVCILFIGERVDIFKFAGGRSHVAVRHSVAGSRVGGSAQTDRSHCRRRAEVDGWYFRA